MIDKRGKVLLIGYGNPGRLDDGLGPALAERISEACYPGVTVDSNYQLTVEDAEAVAAHDTVIFADAAVSGPEPYSFLKIEPNSELNFSTHSIEPQAVLGFAHDLFHAKTEGYVLGIRGYDFDEFGENLSVKAQENLDKASHFVEAVIKEKCILKTEMKQS